MKAVMMMIIVRQLDGSDRVHLIIPNSMETNKIIIYHLALSKRIPRSRKPPIIPPFPYLLCKEQQQQQQQLVKI
jgi:hypothetical protein